MAVSLVGLYPLTGRSAIPPRLLPSVFSFSLPLASLSSFQYMTTYYLTPQLGNSHSFTLGVLDDVLVSRDYCLSQVSHALAEQFLSLSLFAYRFNILL